MATKMGTYVTELVEAMRLLRSQRQNRAAKKPLRHFVPHPLAGEAGRGGVPQGRRGSSFLPPCRQFKPCSITVMFTVVHAG